MTATYATTLELTQFLNVESRVPNREDVSQNRTKETVGNGDGSATAFYVDNAFIVSSSYKFYHGATEGTATALTESTDYILNKDDGIFYLTTTGVSTVDTGNIYGEYSYVGEKITDTQLQEAIDNASKEIETLASSYWADGDATTPDWKVVTEEVHDGQGKFERDYYLDNFPIPDISTTTASAVATTDHAVWVSSTNGFPSSGFVVIEKDKIDYTDKTASAFTGVSNIGTTHAVGATAVPTVIEISTTSSGTEPDWTILEKDSDYHLDLNTGRVHLYTTDYDLTYYALQYPPRLIPNRFRASYIWGYSAIPRTVKRLTLLLAAKEVRQSIARKSAMNGVTEFDRALFNMDDEEIKRLFSQLTNRKTKNI